MAEYNQETCDPSEGGTYSEHVEAVLKLVLTFAPMVGIGFGCRDAYRALQDVAEFIRKTNNFEPYEGDGTLAEQLITEAREKARQAQAEHLPSRFVSE